MKRIYACILIVAALLGVSLYSSGRVQGFAQDISADLDCALEAVRQKDFATARQALAEGAELCDTMRETMSHLLRTADYTELEAALRAADGYLEQQAAEEALGELRRPVMLKRGLSATVEEFLLAAEYILSGGNEQVILCERGVQSGLSAARSALDVAAIPVLKKATHLPVLVDPSHAAGRSELVLPLALAAAAAGADGLMVEVHDRPACALSDGGQALTCRQFQELTETVNALLPHAWRGESI